MKKKYLLLQARKDDDPMIQHEIECFKRSLNCTENDIHSLDIIRENINMNLLKEFNVFIIGGSGDYSIAHGGEWMKKVMHTMNYLYENSKITFASCWGFQAMAKARGGVVVNDLQRAELGTTQLSLTKEGEKDPVFKTLPSKFLAQMGHEDIVEQLPKDAVLLASSDKVHNEAFKFKEKPIYGTQFHPELHKKDLEKRMKIYPHYVSKILGISQKEFISKKCFSSKDTHSLILNFVKHYT